MSVVESLHRAVNRENLGAAEAQSLMERILDGEVSPTLVAALLVALRMKGEAPDELLGFARAMRSRAVAVNARVNGEPLLDTCGTGGDESGTFNISTVSAFVVAGAGVRVAKHGNRSISSQCGSADILEALGVTILADPEAVGRAIREIGIGFLFAPAVHPAMKHAQAARLELKMRTAFNLLGPLTNPAGATAQVVGAPSVRAAELMAQVLAQLGLQRGFVVHGLDGLDEITTTAETLVFEISGGAIADRTVTPEEFGVPRGTREALKGAGRDRNCSIARDILEGRKGPARDIVVVNAAAALVAAGRATDFQHGAALASESLDSGAALRKLRELAAFTATAA
jgi:anthranilate phosphoribosyltransferase